MHIVVPTGSGYAIIYKGYYNDSQGVLHRQDISVK